jgi:hypothetical protein
MNTARAGPASCATHALPLGTHTVTQIKLKNIKMSISGLEHILILPPYQKIFLFEFNLSFLIHCESQSQMKAQ